MFLPHFENKARGAFWSPPPSQEAFWSTPALVAVHDELGDGSAANVLKRLQQGPLLKITHEKEQIEYVQRI